MGKRPALALTLMSLLALLLLVEGLFRLAPEPRFASNVVFDSLLGHRGPLGMFVDFCGNRVFYNQRGMRDRAYDPDVEKKNEKVRVVVLGDSITEAIITSEGSLWPVWLSRVIESATNAPFEIYKFAASDWGTFQEILALETFGQALEPKFVVLQFLGLNDFINNEYSFAEQNQSENDNWRPYFDPNNSAEIKRVEPAKQFLRRSSLAYRYYDSYRVNNYLFGRQGLNFAKVSCDPFLELFLETPGDPRWASAFAATRGIAQRMAASKREGQQILAVYFPSNLEVVEEIWRNGVEAQLRRCYPGKKIDRRKAEKEFLAAFAAAGIEPISLFEAFLAHKNPASLYDAGGHLSNEGHRFVGELIGKSLLLSHGADLGLRR